MGFFVFLFLIFILNGKTFGSLHIWSHSELLSEEAMWQPQLQTIFQRSDNMLVNSVRSEVWVQMCHLGTGYLASIQPTVIYWAMYCGPSAGDIVVTSLFDHFISFTACAASEIFSFAGLSPCIIKQALWERGTYLSGSWLSLQYQVQGYYSYSTHVKEEPVNQMRSLMSHGANIVVGET